MYFYGYGQYQPHAVVNKLLLKQHTSMTYNQTKRHINKPTRRHRDEEKSNN